MKHRDIDVQFHFSNHVLDAGLRELTRGGQHVPVEPQVFDLLVYLVENRDHVVSKDDLIETVWNGRIVSESTLTSRINAARTAVGDSGKSQAVIRTIDRISKPGRRVYSRAEEIPSVLKGLGIYVLSTPKGVLSDRGARTENVGGEILCKVF